MSLEPALSEPKPFRILIDEAMTLARRYFRPIYPAVAIPVSLISVVLSIVQTYWLRGFYEAGGRADISMIFSGCTGFLVAILAAVIVNTLANTAMVAACVDAVDGKGVNMGRSWKFVLRPEVLGTLVMVWIAVAIGLVLLLLPGLYLMLVLSLAAVVMASEGRFGYAALARSAELVRYNPQRLFLANPKTKVAALFSIAWLISMVVGLLIHLPFSVVQNILLARRVASGTPVDPAALTSSLLWFQVPSTFLSSLASMAVALYTSFGLSLLYFDIRRRKEGIDLEAAIARLAGKSQTAMPGPIPAQ
jgi:hypothetical protein